MKSMTLKASAAILLASALFASCSKDKTQPAPLEQELITTVRVNLTPTAGGSTQSFTYKVQNGFNQTTPGTIQIDTMKLVAGAAYSGNITVLNESTNPVENTTEEIIEKNDEHLFVFNSNPPSGAGSVTMSNGNKDKNGKAFNQTFTLTAGSSGRGTLVLTLIHDPSNKDVGTVAGAGGETDAEAIFPVSIQ